MALTWLSPGVIFYPPYVLSALALALAWGGRAGLRRYFARDAWLTRSSAVDLAFVVFYLAWLAPWVVRAESSAFQNTLRWMNGHLGQSAWPNLSASPLVEGALATLVTLLAIDFASYAVHRLMHRVPALWRIHATHHSATQLTPLTTYRQHPLEPLLLNGARGAASGIALAVFHGFFPRQTPVITIFGLGAGFFVYMFTVNLHHSPVPVRYPRWLRAVLISPHIHQLHHSANARHHGADYGVVLSIWDRAFGTYRDEEFAPGELRFGLG